MNTTMQILPAVAAVIFNEKGEVLLQRRKDVDKWCIISGHVEFGETVEEAILREIKEETDTEAAIVRLIGVYSSPESQTYEYEDKTVQYVTTYFEVRLLTGLPEGFTNSETYELKYFAPEKIGDNMATINKHWLQDALDRASVYIR